MKKTVLLFIGIYTLVTGPAAAGDIYWYVAASLAKPGKEVVSRYNRESTESQVLLIIGGSGQLLSKIQLARQGGLYTPASVKFLEKAEKKGLVRHHRLLLYQTPVFGLSRSGQTRIQSFLDLQQPGLRTALGNPKTMALGDSYLKIEGKMGAELSGRIRRNAQISAINISQIVNYLKTDTIDAGTIYDSVARANKLGYIEIPKEFNFQNEAHLIRLIFPTVNEAEVTRFEQYIPKQHLIFKRHGFKLNP